MRPIHLAIEGLRSFRSPAATIDFTDRDHLAIVGDTGAGKSSILEAITYALYGQSTFTAQGNQELMNDTSTHLRVVLRFRVSGETWEVARALRRDGQGRVTPAGAQLRRIGNDGAAVEQIEKVKPVNERIEKLIGLDSDAFLRTVILPQGRFARLLVEDKPTERGRILRQVWRTDDLEEAGALAGDARVKATELRVQLEARASLHPGDPAAHLARLEDEFGQARRQAEAAAGIERAARAARDRLQAAGKMREKASGVAERLRESGIEQVAERLAAIRERARAFDGERDRLQRSRTDISGEIARIPGDDDGPGPGDVASALATLAHMDALVGPAETAADELRRRATEAAGRHGEAGRKSESAQRAAERTARHGERRSPLAESVEAARERRGRVAALHADGRAAERRLAEREGELEATRKDAAELTERLAAARSEAQSDDRAARAARERLEEARGAHAAAAAAYPEEKQRLRDALDEARDRRRDVGLRHDECRARADDRNDAERQLETLRRTHRDLRTRLESAQSKERAALRARERADERLAEERRSDSAAAAARGLREGDECPVCARDLPPDWQAPVAADLQDAERAARAARDEAARLGRNVADLAAQRTGAEKQIDAAAPRVQEADRRFGAAIDALGEAVGTELDRSLPAAEALLAPADEAVRRAAEACDRHQREHDARILDLDRRLRTANETHDETREKAEASRSRAVDLHARLQAAERNSDEAAKRVPVAKREFTAALQALGEAVGTGLTDFPSDPAPLLAPLDAALRDAAGALAAHDEEHRLLQEESSRSSAAAATAREAAAGADRLTDAARESAVKALTQLNDTAASVAGPFRPRLDLPADPSGLQAVDVTAVAERTAAARERERVLTQRAAERARLAGRMQTVEKELTALASRKSAEVDEPRAAAAHELLTHRFLIVGAIEDLEVPADPPPAVTMDDVENLEARLEELRTLTADLARTAKEQADTATSDAEAARSALAGIGERLDADTDRHDFDAIVDRASARARVAGLAELDASNTVEAFRAIFDDVQRLRTLLDAVKERERALGDLDDALKPGAFPKWLTMRRSRSLLVHASRMLGEMSGGKYAFAEPGETDAQWLVLDRDSGQARTPASLSGGEQFIASLSLALGMVEMMARGGGRLESLFLDEGFGSLDRNNLDAAVQALGTVAAGGRMVGVISHVRAVAEQIDHVLAVTRGATGSQAVWLTDRQRRRLSESDAGAEAASALAGLLE